MKGQTLIEFLIALGAGVVILSAIATAVISALNNAQFSKNQNLANQYASQGMEIVRKLRSSNWTEFSSYDGKYCLDKDKTTLDVKKDLKDQGREGCSRIGQRTTSNVDNFAREVDIEQNARDCAITPPPFPTPIPPNLDLTKVTVSVSWFDSKCPSGPNLYCHAVTLVSCFAKVEIIQAP